MKEIEKLLERLARLEHAAAIYKMFNDERVFKNNQEAADSFMQDMEEEVERMQRVASYYD